MTDQSREDAREAAYKNWRNDWYEAHPDADSTYPPLAITGFNAGYAAASADAEAREQALHRALRVVQLNLGAWSAKDSKHPADLIEEVLSDVDFALYQHGTARAALADPPGGAS